MLKKFKQSELAQQQFNQNAEEDMKNIVSEYTRKGITFFAAAIEQDKEVINESMEKSVFQIYWI